MDEMGKPKPYQVGVRIPCGVHPQVPEENFVCRNCGGTWVRCFRKLAEQTESRITTGTIVDATILHAPSSTKNREQKRDPGCTKEERQAVVLR